MNSSFLRADGTIAPPRRRWWSEWLPSLSQIQNAIQLRFDPAPDLQPDTPLETATLETSVWTISMRQGLGLVVLSALLAGLLPFLVNSVTAIRVGAPLPFVELAEMAESRGGAAPSLLGEAFQRVAGLSPALLPGWLAGLLSALGVWINWPLRWLAWWIVYGTAVLLAAKAWSAPATLQHFFAMTSYAAVPMILSGLGPIPCLGAVAQIIAFAWMAAVYVTAVRTVTGLDWGRSVAAVLLPAALLSLLSLVVLLAIATTLLRMIF